MTLVTPPLNAQAVPARDCSAYGTLSVQKRSDGKRVTVSQSIMIGATVDGYSQYPDVVIVQPENSWATYDAAIQDLLGKIDGFEFASESFGSK